MDKPDSAEQRVEQLWQSNEDLRRYAQRVAHDLRAPLRSITGCSQLLADVLADQPLPPEDLELLTTIEASVAQLHQLIGDLLAFSEVDGSQAPSEPTSIPAVHDEVTSLLIGDIGAADAEVECRSDDAVLLPAGQLRLLLRNLVENGIQHKSPDRSVHIVTDSERTPDGWVALTVRDNGRGIQERDLERVTEFLAKMDSPFGTGVGLALVRAIAERQGGTVSISSVAGEGTTVRVLLPAATPDRHDHSDSMAGVRS